MTRPTRTSSRAALLAAALTVLAITTIACSDEKENRPRSGMVFTDAMGEQVTITPPVHRIISLAPNITEIVCALGARDRLIGRTAYCDFPPDVQSVPVVADMLTINFEKVVAARPDLVLMTYVGNTRGNYEKLKGLGVHPFVLHDSSVAQVIAAIDTVGLMIDCHKQAMALSARLRTMRDSLAALAASRPPVTFFIVIDRSPLITANSGFLAEALQLVGGRNIAAGGVTQYPKYSREELLRADPDVILLPAGSQSEIDDLLATYPEWNRLRAVREHHLYALPRNVVLRPGPRIGDGLRLLYEALHGADAQALWAGADKR